MIHPSMCDAATKPNPLPVLGNPTPVTGLGTLAPTLLTTLSSILVKQTTPLMGIRSTLNYCHLNVPTIVEATMISFAQSAAVKGVWHSTQQQNLSPKPSI
jgi:hypothetical protein